MTETLLKPFNILFQSIDSCFNPSISCATIQEKEEATPKGEKEQTLSKVGSTTLSVSKKQQKPIKSQINGLEQDNNTPSTRLEEDDIVIPLFNKEEDEEEELVYESFKTNNISNGSESNACHALLCLNCETNDKIKHDTQKKQLQSQIFKPKTNVAEEQTTFPTATTKRNPNKESKQQQQQQQVQCLPVQRKKENITTNWKHTFWNNYFRQNKNPQVDGNSSQVQLPFDTLLISNDFHQRDISELTMRSSHGHFFFHHHRHSKNVLQINNSKNNANAARIMAYYAIGQHLKEQTKKKSLNNRRCYFTGKYISSNMPFYAGTLKQGYKTLVVFCLPQAIDYTGSNLDILNTSIPSSSAAASHLNKSMTESSASGGTCLSSNANAALSDATQASIPKEERLNRSDRYYYTNPTSSFHNSLHNNNASRTNTNNSFTSGCYSISHEEDDFSTSCTSTSSSSSKSCDYITMRTSSSSSSTSSNEEGSYSSSYYEHLVEQIPIPTKYTLQQLSQAYPSAFSTLPQSIQNHVENWSLYNKFCYFSGLPICPGELHYEFINKRNSKLPRNQKILLSHEILEVVLGKDSVDCVRLPNTAVFDYLKLNYKHQCMRICKENDFDHEDDKENKDSMTCLFQRCNWHIVLPEV